MHSTIIAAISASTGGALAFGIGIIIGIFIGYLLSGLTSNKKEKDINVNVSVPSSGMPSGGIAYNYNQNYDNNNNINDDQSPVVVLKSGLLDDLESNIIGDSQSIKKDISKDLQNIKNINSPELETKTRKRGNKNGK